MSWTNSSGDPIPGATSGNDSFAGTSGSDNAAGLDGDDTLSGLDGTDLLLGGAGDDVLIGGEGFDSFIGGEGDDSIEGGAGDDSVLSDAGNDTFIGGDGNDVISVTGAAGPFSVDGGNDFDFIIVDKSSATSGVSYAVDEDGIVTGGDGSHAENTEYLQVTGSGFADTFSINSGNAQINAGGGDDLIQIGPNTSIYVDAGSGSDTVDLAGWNTADNPWSASTEPAFPGATVYTNSVTGAQVLLSGVETIICFAQGTRVMTPHGEVPVEDLRIGDRVTTADGRAEPIRFIGRQTVMPRFGLPELLCPILIRAGALGENVPVRDLRVSAHHGIVVDGLLCFAQALVNGVSIVQDPAPPEVLTYYSIETTAHEVLLADGTPAESFCDNIAREHFDNHEEFLALYPEGRAIGEMALPQVKSRRQVPARVLALLDARAQALSAPVDQMAA